MTATRQSIPPTEAPASPETGPDCTWDFEDPAACFDEKACGCYVDPCDYFGLSREECCIDMGCEDCCLEMCPEAG